MIDSLEQLKRKWSALGETHSFYRSRHVFSSQSDCFLCAFNYTIISPLGFMRPLLSNYVSSWVYKKPFPRHPIIVDEKNLIGCCWLGSKQRRTRQKCNSAAQDQLLWLLLTKISVWQYALWDHEVLWSMDGSWQDGPLGTDALKASHTILGGKVTTQIQRFIPYEVVMKLLSRNNLKLNVLGVSKFGDSVQKFL